MCDASFMGTYSNVFFSSAHRAMSKGPTMKRLALSLTSAAALAVMAFGTASAQSIPAGSYQQSCTNIRVRGDVLTARCNAPQGGTVRSTISLDSCRRGDIANMNGQLTCNRNGRGRNGNGYGYGNGNGNNGDRDDRNGRNNGYGNNGYGNNGYGNNGYGNNGNGYGLPGGSYQQSCTNATMSGGVLTATCPSGNGQRITTSINPRSCGGADITNRNGRLNCG